MITDGHVRSAITACTKRLREHVTLKDPGERGGGRLTMLVRATKGSASAEWMAVWHRDGARKSTKLGTYPTMSVAEARSEFRERYQPANLEGRDPLGPRVWRRKGSAPTIEEMFEAYVVNRLEAKGKPGAVRMREVLLGESGLANTIGRLKPASTVTAQDIMPHLQAIYDRGKNDYAEFVRATARAAFQWALKSMNDVTNRSAGCDWGLRLNPVDQITRIDRNPPRDRALTPMEFRALWQWLEGKARYLRYRHLARALMIMMATGQRPGEILGISADHFDPVESTLYWPKTKNGRSHRLPLCRQALMIIEGHDPNEYGLYFPRQRIASEPALVDSAAALIEQYIRISGCEPFQTRDLRRTWKTLAADAGIPKEACDRLQNHTYRDVGSKHYDHSDHLALKWRGVEMWEKVMDYILYYDGVVTRRSLGRAEAFQPLQMRITSRRDI